MTSSSDFVSARDYLLAHRSEYGTALRHFCWPRMDRFNWALDYFDEMASENGGPALVIVEEDGAQTTRTFAELARRSNQTANFLRALGIRRGDRILVMLGNETALWELLLAAMKLGAVVIPAAPLLTVEDLRDRVERGDVRHAIAAAAQAAKFESLSASFTRISAGGPVAGWHSLEDSALCPELFTPDGETSASDPLLLYFTSGTTAKPKLVLHTHQSYPVGHLSTMYWIGVREGDVHQNISSPGWAKHAWSSFFAPFNAGATVLVHDAPRFSAKRTIELLSRCRVSTLCAPPTVWRMLIVDELGPRPEALHDLVSAGEPLNPEVIDRVQQAWGITIRDGYGQTETTALVGNTPGQVVKPGSMGRPLPGYEVAL